MLSYFRHLEGKAFALLKDATLAVFRRFTGTRLTPYIQFDKCPYMASYCVYVLCMCVCLCSACLTNVLIWQSVVCMCVQCNAISYEIKIR